MTVQRLARNIEEVLTGTFLVLMCLATLANVLARYAFGAPIPWAEEFSRYSFIWVVFLGGALCSKHGRHIAVDALVMTFRPPLQAACRLAVHALTAALMLVLIYYGGVLVGSATYPTSTLGISTYWVYLAVPVSAVLVLVHTVADVSRDMATTRRGARA